MLIPSECEDVMEKWGLLKLKEFLVLDKLKV